MEMLKDIKLTTNVFKSQPCCGFFLQGGVKAIAIVDLGLHFALIIVLIVGIIVGQPVWYADPPAQHFARPFYWTFYFTYWVISMGLSIFLFRMANKRNGRQFNLYLTISIVLYILWLGIYLSHSIWLHGLHPMVIATFGGVSVFKVYSFWVVKCFVNEISYYGGFNAALRELTDEEIAEFENGHPTIPPDSETYSNGNFLNRPYKRDFEIPLERLELDENNILGAGAFGTVYKGNLLADPKGLGNGDGSDDTPVAVKTVDPNADLTYFKALFSELKILSYIGTHENIVNLIGACTSQIREKKILIIVEFCPYGNMLNYLRANRGLFINMINNGELVSNYTGGSYSNNIPNAPSTVDLIRWAAQTAKGMEYLVSKKVLHGDLAARNVLLTQDRSIKIADFGLSRQLYHYSTYIKRNDEPLPWRWMSIESLIDMNFSSHSDVWSYGITLWEYFTCAGTPFPGCSYSGDFVKQLRNGLRPEQPQYSNIEIYKIMQTCWYEEPSSRPSFTELVYLFEQLLSKYDQYPYLQLKPVSPLPDVTKSSQRAFTIDSEAETKGKVPSIVITMEEVMD